MLGLNQEPSRKIIIASEINDDVAGQVIASIIEVNAYDEMILSDSKSYQPLPIEMYITSGGGSATAGFAIIGAMEMSSTPIVTYGLGIVASMALGIFVSGDYRISSRFTRYMYHSVAYGTMGNIKDHEDALKESDIMQRMYNSLFEDTGITKEMMKLARDKKEDLFFSPSKAKEYKLVDFILDKPEKRLSTEEVTTEAIMEFYEGLVDKEEV